MHMKLRPHHFILDSNLHPWNWLCFRNTIICSCKIGEPWSVCLYQYKLINKISKKGSESLIYSFTIFILRAPASRQSSGTSRSRECEEGWWRRARIGRLKGEFFSGIRARRFLILHGHNLTQLARALLARLIRVSALNALLMPTASDRCASILCYVEVKSGFWYLTFPYSPKIKSLVTICTRT